MNGIHNIERTLDECIYAIYSKLNEYDIDDLKDALDYMRDCYPSGVNLIGMAEDCLDQKEIEENEDE